MRLILIGAMFTAISAMAGCGSSSDEALSPGERAFRANCRSCHRLPKPSSFDHRQWRDILDEHSDRLSMDSAATALVESHLLANN